MFLSFALVTSDSFPAKSTSVLFWSTQCELCKFCLTQCRVEQLLLSTACTVRELSGTSGACCLFLCCQFILVTRLCAQRLKRISCVHRVPQFWESFFCNKKLKKGFSEKKVLKRMTPSRSPDRLSINTNLTQKQLNIRTLRSHSGLPLDDSASDKIRTIQDPPPFAQPLPPRPSKEPKRRSSLVIRPSFLCPLWLRPVVPPFVATVRPPFADLVHWSCFMESFCRYFFVFFGPLFLRTLTVTCQPFDQDELFWVFSFGATEKWTATFAH